MIIHCRPLSYKRQPHTAIIMVAHANSAKWLKEGFEFPSFSFSVRVHVLVFSGGRMIESWIGKY
jgi:hypothetical protein